MINIKLESVGQLWSKGAENDLNEASKNEDH